MVKIDFQTLSKNEKISIKIAQISDSHLLNDPMLTIHGVNPFERLLRVLESRLDFFCFERAS